VYYTRDGIKVIKRVRICRNCSRRIVTQEKIIGQAGSSPQE
jgi:transcriptional regulator NrdR family protein